MTPRPNLAERRAPCDAAVTLNGNRAYVSGAKCDFARVTDIATGLGCEWAWPTVARIVADRGGRLAT